MARVSENARREENRADLERRLKEVGLDMGIYEIEPPKYIRINPRNSISIEELAHRLKKRYGVDVIFEPTGIEGIYRSPNSDIGGQIGNHANEFFMKHYFIQDLASVLAVLFLELKGGEKFLDLCAAHGFKTILAHDLVNGQLDITAIDIDKKRYERLIGFLRQFDIKAETHKVDGITFEGGLYDKVLVDAPCSDEGWVRRYDPELKKEVSGLETVLKIGPRDIMKNAELQLALLQSGFNHLKVGGILVYSTCTMNRTENEGVISEFLGRNHEALIYLPRIPDVGSLYQQSEYGIRIIPGSTKGMFIARIRKTE